MAHTPGPWRVEGDALSHVVTDYEPEDERFTGYAYGNNFVCDLNDGEYHEYLDAAEQKANAHLIAAAPELLAACEKLGEYAREIVKHVSSRKSDDELDNILADAIILAMDAAKKAKGA